MSEKEKNSKTARPPSAAAGRVVGVFVGAVVGMCTAVAGLMAGVPAPDILLRSVGAGVVAKIVAGLIVGLGIRSVVLERHKAQAATEGDR